EHRRHDDEGARPARAGGVSLRMPLARMAGHRASADSVGAHAGGTKLPSHRGGERPADPLGGLASRPSTNALTPSRLARCADSSAARPAGAERSEMAAAT